MTSAPRAERCRLTIGPAKKLPQSSTVRPASGPAPAPAPADSPRCCSCCADARRALRAATPRDATAGREQRDTYRDISSLTGDAGGCCSSFSVRLMPRHRLYRASVYISRYIFQRGKSHHNAISILRSHDDTLHYIAAASARKAGACSGPMGGILLQGACQAAGRLRIANVWAIRAQMGNHCAMECDNMMHSTTHGHSLPRVAPGCCAGAGTKSSILQPP
jgi:hypothetical protein